MREQTMLRAAMLVAATALAGVPHRSEAQASVTSAPAAAQPGAPQMDAGMRAVLEAMQGLGARPLEGLEPAAARRQPTPADAVRRVMEQRNIQSPAAMRAVQARDLQVQGADGMLPARLYTPDPQQRPRQDAAMPLIIYWHGGGWVIADLDTYDATPRALAAQTGAAVLSVHYRQAPEHRFPAAHDDAVASYRWAVGHARELGADPERMALAGESAGGNLALNVAVAARDQRLQAPLHVLAVYPVAGADMGTPSYQENAQARPLSRAGMEWFVRHVFQDPSQAQDPRIALATRMDLTGLPPVTLITAQIDPLRSEGERLSQRLRQAGVAVQWRNFDGVTHEFFGMAPVVADATAAQQFAAQQLRGAFGAGGQGMPMAQAAPGAAATAGADASQAGPAAQADRTTGERAAGGGTNATGRPSPDGMAGAATGGAGMAGNTAAAMLAPERARALVGTDLVSAEGRNTGEIDNFIVDGAGRVRAAVVEWGGFLGIGERRAVVPLGQIQLGEGNERARLLLTREQLEALPRYERGRIAEIGREQGWEGARLLRE